MFLYILSVVVFMLLQQSWVVATEIHKAYNIYYLALYRKSLLTADLKGTMQKKIFASLQWNLSLKKYFFYIVKIFS